MRILYRIDVSSVEILTLVTIARADVPVPVTRVNVTTTKTRDA